MRLDHSFRRTLVAAMTLAAACHDSTSPAPPAVVFDAAHARARVEPLARIFDQPIFASFQSAMTFFEPYFRSGASIPDSVKGKTFIYDLASQAYVIDPAANDVPPGDVRFILYAWVGGSAPNTGSRLAAKTRYRQADAPCVVALAAPSRMELEFATEQWAVTPGQSVVLYDGEVCLGGGVIDRAYAGTVSANEARSESLA